MKSRRKFAFEKTDEELIADSGFLPHQVERILRMDGEEFDKLWNNPSIQTRCVNAMYHLRERHSQGNAPQDNVYVGDCVYLLKVCKHNLFKIGITNDLKRRVKQIAKSHNVDIEILHVIPSTDKEELEKRLHNKYRYKRFVNEWFALTEEDVEYIKQL